MSCGEYLALGIIIGFLVGVFLVTGCTVFVESIRKKQKKEDFHTPMWPYYQSMGDSHAMDSPIGESWKVSPLIPTVSLPPPMLVPVETDGEYISFERTKLKKCKHPVAQYPRQEHYSFFYPQRERASSA